MTTLVYNSFQTNSFSTGNVTYKLDSISEGLYTYKGDSTTTIDGDGGGGYTGDNVNLTSVVLVEGITEIQENTFNSSPNIASVTISSTVITIAAFAFNTTSSLTTYTFNCTQGSLTTGYDTEAFGPSGGEDGANISYTTQNTLVRKYFIDNYPEANGTVSCFNKGTKILCLNHSFEEEYIPIENLRKGDIVKSYLHGYRKIDSIGKGFTPNRENLWYNSMFKMVKTEENELLEDLIVTGGHAILVDDLGEYKEKNKELLGDIKIDDKYLLLSSLSDKFVKIIDNEIYEYYHLSLENDNNNDRRFGIWANGILTETVSKNQFLNHPYFELE